MPGTNFKSDNVTAACPEVMEALLRANADEAANSYGGTVGGTEDEPDPSTLHMNQLFEETFECPCVVFPVVSSSIGASGSNTTQRARRCCLRCSLTLPACLALTLTAAFWQATGTAANMLALATVTPPYGVVYSPAGSHAASDECNAPESAMSGAKFIAVPSPVEITPSPVSLLRCWQPPPRAVPDRSIHR